MIACFDVHYQENSANAAAVVFDDWQSATARYTKQVHLNDIQAYTAGSFYKRELPPLLKVISALPERPSVIIIDGYCELSDSAAPGLGRRLFDSLDYTPTMIGVAKNRFRKTTHAIEILRGDSAKPLFVTAIGISPKDAANNIKTMHGKHRLPTLLKAVDSLARGHIE